MKKLMHILLTFGLMLCLVEPVISQDSVADVFPLAIGNQWRYEYTTFKLEPPADIIYTDSGWVQYMVTDRTIFADSTLWTLMQQGISGIVNGLVSRPHSAAIRVTLSPTPIPAT